MDERYSPPKSPVADITPTQGPLRQPPRQIVLAIQLAVASYCLRLLAVIVSWDYYFRLQPVVMIVLTLGFSFVVSVWLYWKIYSGRNWARITLLVFTGVGVLAIVGGGLGRFMATVSIVAKISTFVGTGITFVVLWLLFLTPGREWFRTQSR